MLYLLRNSEEKTISQVKFFVLRAGAACVK
jgi:hypothetical protein